MIISFHLPVPVASFGGIALALAVATSPASAVKCGDVITNNAVLNADLTCTCAWKSPASEPAAAALEVVGPATLDLKGHTVSCGDKFGNEAAFDNDDFHLMACLTISGKGATVKNGIFTECMAGIAGNELGVEDVLIKDIIATNIGYYGIAVVGNNNRLHNVTIDNYLDVGIYLEGNNNEVKESNVTNGLHGIDLKGNDNHVKSSYVARTDYAGIEFIGNNNNARSNTVENGNVFSCMITNGVGNVVKNNTVRRCSGFGVNSKGNNSIITGNTFYSTAKASIYATLPRFFNGTGHRITGNRIEKSGADGIVIARGQEKTVVARNVIVDSVGNGILLATWSARSRVLSNTVSKCGKVGLWIKGADGNNVTDNEISSCTKGIVAGLGSNRNRLINNRASNNALFDLNEMSANCGSNIWKGNTGKGNIACTQQEK